MNYYVISALINVVLSVFLGLFVIYKNPREKLNRSLFYWCLSLFTWSFFYFVWQVETDSNKALLWTRLLMLGAIWIPVTFFRVVIIFLDIYANQKKLYYISIVSAFIFTFLLPTSLMVTRIEKEFDFNFWPKPGYAYPFFLFMFLGLTIYGAMLSLRAMKVSDPRRKSQIKFMLIGMVISILTGSTNYFLWYDIPIKPYGNMFASTYAVFTIYAIIVHRLMDIKLILRKYTVFLISVLSVLIPSLVLQYIFDVVLDVDTYFEDALIVVLAVFIFPSVREYFHKIANKYFFSSLYDSREVIANLSERMQSTLEVEKIYSFITNTFENTFHIKSVGVLIYNEKKDEYFVQYNNNSSSEKFLQFSGSGRYVYKGIKVNSELEKKYLSLGHPIIVDELKVKEKGRYKKMIEQFDQLDIEIMIPLNVKKKILGMIVLGEKESREMYNDEDIYVLKVIGVQVAIAIENALLYKEVKDFNIKLEKEIWKATRELVEANEKLQKLDEAKSDFISIASHQLRTPLTVIKGYISMVLDGNFGKMKNPQTEALKKVYESNERLIQLVEDLLSISRIESGRIQYEFKESQLEDTVLSVFEELTQVAQKKGLNFIIEAPKTKLPPLMLDNEKIRQVIMNLTDNAIKYTEKGSVKVILKKNKNYIRYSVEDTGMGIKSDDMPHLFKKFSRGTGTFLVHTEGTGLGLYVAKEMAEEHGGRVWAESDGPGRGSRFHFEIDLVENDKLKK